MLGGLSIDWALFVIAVWLVLGLLGLAALRRFELVARVLFPLGALAGLVLAFAAVQGLLSTPEVAVLPIGLPQLPFHLRLDPLAAFFLFVIGAAGCGISLFAAGYFRKGEGTPPGLLCFEYHLFLASMALVVLADDAYAFMVAWESMALSSYFLVTTNHKVPEIRAAGFLYLLIAHVGAIAILLCFGVLQANTGDYTFANMRIQQLSPFWASAAFLLAVFGFGAKAGVLPLHVWLPEAHPAAPSPVSALMSGVMLKTAIYGLLRVGFDLLHLQLWWWGVLLLALGLATALFGVVFATVQSDMKRLLAYSSIENIGLLLAAIGLALVFRAYGMTALAALALTACLYHVASHAFFKSLLFLTTGSVLHATGERNLGHLGGLMRFMPWVAWLALIGVFASSGLPPFSGFVSEWLLLQSFLFTPGLPDSFLNMLIPLAAAAVALTAALAGYAMVKFFGVIFLGQPREEKLRQAHDAGMQEKAGMLWLAAWCVALGLLPNLMIRFIDPVTEKLVGQGLAQQAAANGWWLLTPTSIERASYGPLFFLLGVAAACAIAFVLVRLFYHGRLRRAAPWGCGYPWLTPRMQDTAEGYGQPIRQIFEPFFRLERQLPAPADRQPFYQVMVSDRFWHGVYLPIARAVEFLAALVGRLQQGRIATYLLYSFLTLLFMLLMVPGVKK
ncbi:MAG: hydrogenase 4 subunit B [Betaproteobacteria bacterium HGW-Betaproteobacteria-11]|nr:MAG: hydrogenase 4 subunit B [Betaproteobacteria bacterium HGW-Betaproteobacteria-11]